VVVEMHVIISYMF